MKISTITTDKKVVTISADASLHDLVTELIAHQVGALVVSGDGLTIDGIVSERDVIRAMQGKFEQLDNLHVRDFMTVGVHTCTPDSTIADLMSMMTQRRIRHVPVVDSVGNLQSIVSIGDIVKNYVSEIDTERQALKDYVSNPG